MGPALREFADQPGRHYDTGCSREPAEGVREHGELDVRALGVRELHCKRIGSCPFPQFIIMHNFSLFCAQIHR